MTTLIQLAEHARRRGDAEGRASAARAIAYEARREAESFPPINPYLSSLVDTPGPRYDAQSDAGAGGSAVRGRR